MPLQIFARRNTPVQIKKLQRAFESLLAYAKLSRAHVELSLIGAKRMQQINWQWRKKNKVTDVLSFPQETKAPKAPQPWLLGEILIATPVAAAQAKKEKRSLTQQVIRLAVHGLVHLQGLDHERSGQEEKKFFQLEEKYLKHLKRMGFF